jgi:hypothetical protein
VFLGSATTGRNSGTWFKPRTRFQEGGVRQRSGVHTEVRVSSAGRTGV